MPPLKPKIRWKIQLQKYIQSWIYSRPRQKHPIFLYGKSINKLEYVFDKHRPRKSHRMGLNEETDLLVRLLQKNVLIAKDENIRIIHHSSQGSLKKTLQYGMGRYELIKRNKLGIYIYLINLLQPIVRLVRKPQLKHIPTCLMTIIGRSGLINTLIYLGRKYI